MRHSGMALHKRHSPAVASERSTYAHLNPKATRNQLRVYCSRVISEEASGEASRSNIRCISITKPNAITALSEATLMNRG